MIDRLLEEKQNIFKSAHRKKTKQFQVFDLNNDEALAQPSTHPQHIYEAHIDFSVVSVVIIKLYVIITRIGGLRLQSSCIESKGTIIPLHACYSHSNY